MRWISYPTKALSHHWIYTTVSALSDCFPPVNVPHIKQRKKIKYCLPSSWQAARNLRSSYSEINHNCQPYRIFNLHVFKKRCLSVELGSLTGICKLVIKLRIFFHPVWNFNNLIISWFSGVSDSFSYTLCSAKGLASFPSDFGPSN